MKWTKVWARSDPLLMPSSNPHASYEEAELDSLSSPILSPSCQACHPHISSHADFMIEALADMASRSRSIGRGNQRRGLRVHVLHHS